MHDAVGRVLHHGQHPQHRDSVRQETVECGVDDGSDGTVRAAHDRLHVADRAEKVTEVDGGRAAEADDQILREVGHPDHLVRTDLAGRHDQIPSVEEELVDLDGNSIRQPPARELRDLVGADLPEPHQSFPPPVPEDVVERNPVAEEQIRIALRHRHVRAQRGQHRDLAAGGGQAFEQPSRDLPGARVQPGDVGRDEEHAPRARGDDLGRRDPVDELAQLVDRDGPVGAADGEERNRHQPGSEK